MNKITRRTTLLSGYSLALALCLGSASTFAGVGTVTVELKASDGVTGVAGATVKYYKSGEKTLGTTDADGTFSALISDVNTTTIYLEPLSGGRRTWLLVDPATNPKLTAQMVAVTIELKTCAGVSLAGVAQYYRGGWKEIGNTPTTIDLLPNSNLGPGQGSYDFKVNYNGRNSVTMRQDVSVDPMVVFKTTKVTLLGGPIYYYNDGWKTFTSPQEMVGTQADFKFGSNRAPTVTLNFSGCEFTGGMLRLLDESGKGVAGGKATPAIGGSWQPQLPGATDAAGQLWFDGGTAWTKVKMTVNQSGQEQTKAQLSASGYTFQTSTATINVRNWAGVGMAGVVIDQGGGHWVGGIATTDAKGVARVPMFPGSGTFRANWNKTAQTISQAVPGTIVFQTGQVHSVSGTCTAWATSSHNVFTQDMEVFPGTYRFGTPYVYYTILAGIVNEIP